MDDLKKDLNEVANAVEDLPEHLQEVAFSTILEHRLEHGTSTGAEESSSQSGSDPDSNGSDASENDDIPWLDDVVDDTPDVHEVANGSRKEQAVWAVTYLVANGESATTESVRNVIKNRLGVTPQGRSNMSKTLGELTPKYLSREEKKDGKGYSYTPMRNADDIYG